MVNYMYHRHGVRIFTHEISNELDKLQKKRIEPFDTCTCTVF